MAVEGLYLGAALDDGSRVTLDTDHLTTHAVCLGMTGSGKTGLGVVALRLSGVTRLGPWGVASVFAAMVLGVPLGTWAEKRWGKKDPGPFVIDEVAGYFTALFRVHGPSPGIAELLVAFFVFRVFDVVKPAPARRLENLPGGLGIMIDDIVAGLYSLLAVGAYRTFVLGQPF